MSHPQSEEQVNNAPTTGERDLAGPSTCGLLRIVPYADVTTSDESPAFRFPEDCVARIHTTATDPPATGLTHVITLVVTYNQMVVDEFTSDEVDRVFHALADATRRDIVGRVSQREQSISSLANHYSMSFAAVQKHVAVLERATLVTKERRGRQQIVHPNIEALNKAARLLDAYAFIWQERASRIADILADD